VAPCAESEFCVGLTVIVSSNRCFTDHYHAVSIIANACATQTIVEHVPLYAASLGNHGKFFYPSVFPL
jgi:hypothetical protein